MGLLDGLFTNQNTGGGNALGVPVTIAADGLFNDVTTKDAGAVLATVPAAHTITGRRRFTGMQAQQVWTNVGPADLVFRHNDSGTSASDRIVCPLGVDFVLRAGKSVTLVDDVASSRTRVAQEDADRAGTAGKADAVATITSDALAATVGVSGQHVVTTGKSADGDGGHGEFVFVAGDTTPDDGGRVRGTNPAGRWKSRRSKRVIYAEEYIGALDGTNKNTALLGLWTAAKGTHADVVFPAGDLVFSVQQQIPRGIKVFGNQHRADAVSATGSIGAQPTRFWWDGTSTTTAMLATSQFQRISGIHFFAKPGRTAFAAGVVTTGFEGDNPSGVAWDNCACWGHGSFSSDATYGQGRFSQGLILGPGAIGNVEEVRVRDFIFANFEQYGIYVAGGQPYHTKIEDCFFGCSDRAVEGDTNGSYTMWGWGIYNTRGSAGFIVRNPVFSRLEVGFYNSADPAFVNIENADCEFLKKLVWSSTSGFNNGRTRWTIQAGRYDTFHSSKTANFAANDYELIDIKNGSPVEINGGIVGGDGTPPFVALNEATLIEGRGFLNVPTPVRRYRRIGTSVSGGTFVKTQWFSPDADGYGSVARSTILLSGCENPDLNATIGGATATDVWFGFGSEEVAPPVVQFIEQTVSGTPAAGTWSIVAGTLTVNGFLARRSVAAGAGASVQVTAVLRLPYVDSQPGAIVESGFATDTVFASAAGAGPNPGAVDHWMIWVLSRLNVNAGTPGMVCANASGTTGFALLRTSGNGIAFCPDFLNTTVIAEPSAPTIAPIRTDVFGIRYVASTHRYDLFRGDIGNIANGTFTWAPASGQRFMVGRSTYATSNGYPASNVVLHAFGWGNGAPTDAELMAAMAQSYASGRTHAPAGRTDVNRYVFNGSSAATDLAGTANLSLVSGTAPGTAAVRKSWRK